MCRLSGDDETANLDAVSHTPGLHDAVVIAFVPPTWERFDLALRQRDYFLAGPQALFRLMRSEAFRARAAELGGYDTAAAGEVRLVH